MSIQRKIKHNESNSKIYGQLQPEWPLHKSAVSILRRLQDGMSENENGILEDIDPEFLHKFRVSVRRIRSALSQIKKVFPPAQTKKWKKKFKTLGCASNRLRDLDVFLLKKEEYKNLLPDRRERDRLFSDLKAKREQEIHTFIHLLKSDFYIRLKENWKTFLQNQERDDAVSRKAERSTLMSARDILRHRMSLVLKKGGRINTVSPDEDLHALRIECKKLRYSIEFFSSLFSDKDMRDLITHLKTLQDHLGQHNDICIEQEELKKFLSTQSKKLSEEDLIRLSASVVGLIARLEEQKKTGRESFDLVFKEFTHPVNLKHFNRLFKTR
jgi:CHAD domain-containing protein